MQHIAFTVWIVCGLLSLALTLKYLPAGVLFLLCLPLFPFFGIYAGISEGDWVPAAMFFGSLSVSVMFSKRRTNP